MKKVTLTKGLPAAGKTTWANALVTASGGQIKRVNKDDLRRMLDDGGWSGARERFILRARDALILTALEAGHGVVVDDTNLAPKHETHIRELVTGLATVEVADHFLAMDVEECIRRDARRPNYVGEKVIRDMYNRFLRPQSAPLEQDGSLPIAVICDLDGTLALFGDANPYDRDFMQDQLNGPVWDLVDDMAYCAGCDIIITSGRNDRFRGVTEQWLKKHDVPYDLLLMRVDGDTRKDTIVKKELFEQHIAGKYYVKFVLDDRDSVVRQWREMGLTCLQVAEGSF